MLDTLAPFLSVRAGLRLNLKIPSLFYYNFYILYTDRVTLPLYLQLDGDIAVPF